MPRGEVAARHVLGFPFVRPAVRGYNIATPSDPVVRGPRLPSPERPAMRSPDPLDATPRSPAAPLAGAVTSRRAFLRRTASLAAAAALADAVHTAQAAVPSAGPATAPCMRRAA